MSFSYLSVMYLSGTCLHVWETGKYLNVDLKNQPSVSPVYVSCLLVLPSKRSVNHIKTCHFFFFFKKICISVIFRNLLWAMSDVLMHFSMTKCREFISLWWFMGFHILHIWISYTQEYLRHHFTTLCILHWQSGYITPNILLFMSQEANARRSQSSPTQSNNLL